MCHNISNIGIRDRGLGRRGIVKGKDGVGGGGWGGAAIRVKNCQGNTNWKHHVI